jgi:hypothetical protein
MCKSKINPSTCEGCPVYVTIFNLDWYRRYDTRRKRFIAKWPLR